MILLAGAAAVAVYPLAFYTSMSLAGVAVGVTLTIGSSPVAAALIERIACRRRLPGAWAASTAAAVSGAVLLGASDARLGNGPPRSIAAGIVLALAAGSCYAGYSVAAGHLISRGAPPRVAMGSMFGLAAALLLPVLALTGQTLLTAAHGILVAAYLAVFPMGIGYLLFGRGLQGTPASTATAVSLLEPVVAALLAELVAGQQLSGLGWAGIARCPSRTSVRLAEQ